MWEQVERVLRQSAAQIADHVANFLPGVLVAVLLIAVAFVAAMLARVLIVRGLRGLSFDRRMEQLGIAPPGGASTTQAVGVAVYWTILVLGLLLSLTALNATIPSRLADTVFAYLPHLVAALLILLLGVVAARFLARSVLIGAVNMHLHSARLLSLFVKWLVLVIAIAMALDHLGIGRTVLLLAFGIIFGGIVLTASLAVGLGARDVVARALERQFHEAPGPKDDHVDHV
jgi:Mechanosensitive ion channel, conserved TM helix